MMDKVVRDGRVAVIVSPGYGAGWSTWAQDRNVCFDPILVEWIEKGKVGDPPLDHYGDSAPYCGGLRDAVIRWIPQGTGFEITDYDGSESLRYLDADEWMIA